MKHLLFVLDYYTPHLGGLETVFQNYISRLLHQGYQITVITMKFSKGLKKMERQENLTIYRVGSNRINFLWRAFLKGLSVVKHADIIHTTTFAGAFPGWLLSKWSGKPIVLTVHEVFGKLRYIYKGRKGWFFELFESLILKLSYTTIHCVSLYTKNCLRVSYGIPDEKLITIYNGVDHQSRSPDHLLPDLINGYKHHFDLHGKYVGMYFGHSGMSKGLDYFIKAIPHIVMDNPDFIAIINLIPGNRDQIIHHLVHELKLTKHVLFFNGLEQRELINMIGVADVVIVPSLSDGFGLAAAETSHLNKKLIVTNCSALPEVSFGQVRFINPANVQDIVTAFKELKEDKGIHYIKPKKFDRDHSTTQLTQLYQKVLDECGNY